MDKLTIPNDALILIADGQKALFLRNRGDRDFPDLSVEQVFKTKDPPTREQGSDRPGRTFKRAHTNLRSSVETTDWHTLQKDRFARDVADALEKIVHSNRAQSIVLVAPAHTLAELRKALHADVKNRLIAEVAKDLTNIPVWQIQKHLVG